ncbi:MAG: rhomboid family intramembrane serine protease [Leptolyngbyaceae cyanobacterium HOT.MB2.61]|nr:rhomboid family intramembrane serine protease [Leptolyngbyaceae cyanobacterium HOT.MB2.61]
MVPLRDENPTRITPYVTYGLIAVNILVFLFESSLMGTPYLEAFIRHWSIVPAQLTASFHGDPNYPLLYEGSTLITSQFLHAGLLHVGGNMLYLWIFGNNVEEQMGQVRFLLFYLLCGVLAALAQCFFAPGSTIPSLGASGAIAGVMGAYILRFPQVRILTVVPFFIFFTTLQIPAIVYLGIWFVQQALYGFASFNTPTMVGMEGGGVAYWAHAGGFVFGAVLGPLFGLFSKPTTPNAGPDVQSPGGQLNLESPDSYNS